MKTAQNRRNSRRKTRKENVTAMMRMRMKMDDNDVLKGDVKQCDNK